MGGAEHALLVGSAAALHRAQPVAGPRAVQLGRDVERAAGDDDAFAEGHHLGGGRLVLAVREHDGPAAHRQDRLGVGDLQFVARHRGAAPADSSISLSEWVERPIKAPRPSRALAASTGRSSWPRWTPPASANRATSGRSLTRRSALPAQILRASRAICTKSPVPIPLSRSCTTDAPPRTNAAIRSRGGPAAPSTMAYTPCGSPGIGLYDTPAMC